MISKDTEYILDRWVGTVHVLQGYDGGLVPVLTSSRPKDAAALKTSIKELFNAMNEDEQAAALLDLTKKDLIKSWVFMKMCKHPAVLDQLIDNIPALHPFNSKRLDKTLLTEADVLFDKTIRDLVKTYLVAGGLEKLLKCELRKHTFVTELIALEAAHENRDQVQTYLILTVEKITAGRDAREVESEPYYVRDGFTPFQMYEDVFKVGLPAEQVAMVKARISELWSPDATIIRDPLIEAMMARHVRMVEAIGVNKFNIGNNDPSLFPQLNAAEMVVARIMAEDWYRTQKRVLRPSTGWMSEIADAEIRVPLKHIRAPFETVYIDFSGVSPRVRIMVDDPSYWHAGKPMPWIRGVFVSSARVCLRGTTLKTGEVTESYIIFHFLTNDVEACTIMYNLGSETENMFPSELFETRKVSKLGQQLMTTIWNLFLYMSHVKEDVQNTPPKDINVPLKVRGERGKRKQARRQEKANEQIDLYVVGQQILIPGAKSSSDNDRMMEGGYKRPHWRRGHWRMQWYGSERFGDHVQKPKFIEALLVNKHRLATDKPETEMGTYAVEEKPEETKPEENAPSA